MNILKLDILFFNKFRDAVEVQKYFGLFSKVYVV